MYVYTCAWGRDTCIPVAHGGHGDIECLLLLMSPCSFETDLSLNLKLTDSARLGGQKAVRICPFLIPNSGVISVRSHDYLLCGYQVL